MLIRKPHVAGSFYPSEPSELREYCERYLSAQNRPQAKAVILPHAGYVYSGETACLTLEAVRVPETVFLMGPNHWGTGSDFALYAQGEWETPLGRTPVAGELAAALLEACPSFKMDTAAHTKEHSLEVLIPFLQTKNPKFRMVPLIVGTLDFDQAAEAADDLGEALAGKKDLLIVVSNDMSHYDPDALTRQKDRYALDAILNLDAEALADAVHQHHITMCGLIPVYMLLAMHEALGITEAQLVDYRTSADASGDTSRVVGYAGFIFR